MKLVLNTFLLCLSVMATVAQIPNGNFEEWETIDTIENPVHWQTNNHYVDYAPVVKVEDAIDGDYSMKISSTARDIFGTATWPGCAHVKLLPTDTYQYMTASIKIDSIEMGEIEIRVKQRTTDGFFEKIGGWQRETVTNGVSHIWFPIEQTSLDTLLIEIWAFNQDEPAMGNTGYSEAIIDNLTLTNTVATQQAIEADAIDWLISPNPAKDMVTVRLDRPLTSPFQLLLLDLQGRVHQTHNFTHLKETTFNLEGILPGVYILALRKDGLTLQQSKVVVIR